MIDRKLLKRLATPLRRAHGRVAMAVGRAGSGRPLCRHYGYTRGTPIDRFYIERFLEEHRGDIRGHVLEIGDDSYSKRFGGDRIDKQDILRLRPGDPHTTIVGDLTQPGVLAHDTFDCIILTQTLQFIFDTAAALRQVRQALRPGGVALITVPGISAIDRGEWGDSWCWSFSSRALEQLLLQSFDHDRVAVSSFGNLFAATAFLHGAAVEEVSRSKLRRLDKAYPVTVAARAER